MMASQHVITTRTASTDFPGSFALKCSAGREGEGRTLAGAVHMRTAAPSHEQRTFWRAHERPDTQQDDTREASRHKQVCSTGHSPPRLFAVNFDMNIR